jgi:hypothetical protein
MRLILLLFAGHNSELVLLSAGHEDELPAICWSWWRIFCYLLVIRGDSNALSDTTVNWSRGLRCCYWRSVRL